MEWKEQEFSRQSFTVRSVDELVDQTVCEKVQEKSRVRVHGCRRGRGGKETKSGRDETVLSGKERVRSAKCVEFESSPHRGQREFWRQKTGIRFTTHHVWAPHENAKML